MTWRKRSASRRLDGLDDEPRCGAPRKIGDDKIADVVTKTLETMLFLCDALEHTFDGKGVRVVRFDRASHLARILAAASSPRDLQAFHYPQFVEKVRDIVGLYLDMRSALSSCV